MKPIVCVSTEGNDTKIVVLSKEKNGIKVNKSFSMTMTSGQELNEGLNDHSKVNSMKEFDAEFELEGMDAGSSSNELGAIDKNDVSFAANYFGDEELKNAEFIPVVSDPIVNHHTFTGHVHNNKQKTINAIVEDIEKQKNISVGADFVDFIKLDDNTLHSVFIKDDNTSVNFINSWATHNQKKYYKIASIKNSETALAHYVAKTNKFFDEDFTLIIFTGHESSKLIFLKGNKLHHIGTSLDIGTKNIHTYDVYFSKILLEMENGGISRLDNVILSGEDISENFILSFYGTFPEADVREIKYPELDITALTEEQRDELPSFALTIAAGLEYFEEKEGKHTGINFLPKYIIENQKFIQFGWHSIVVFPFLFIAAFFFTFQMLEKSKEIAEQESEIQRLKALKAQNELIVEEITTLSDKIANFDQVQSKLDAATEGTEAWGNILTNISDFIERRRSFWISSLESNADKKVNLRGYTLSRNVLTDFVDENSSSMLNNLTYEPVRATKAYTFALTFNMNNDNGAVQQ